MKVPHKYEIVRHDDRVEQSITFMYDNHKFGFSIDHPINWQVARSIVRGKQDLYESIHKSSLKYGIQNVLQFKKIKEIHSKYKDDYDKAIDLYMSSKTFKNNLSKDNS